MRRVLVGVALAAGASAIEISRRRAKSRHVNYESGIITPAMSSTENESVIETFSESESHNQSRPLFRNLKWPTLLGNIGIGAAEVFAGGGSTLAVTVDGVHNLGDAVGYGAQFYAEEARRPERVRRLRKIGHWIIASSSAVVGAKAAYDLAAQNEHVAHPAGLIAAGASLALNGYLGRDIIPKVRRIGWRRMTSTQRDIAKHFLFVDAPSSVLAVGGAVAAGASVHQASAAAAVVSGAVGAWVFRPTEHNLEEPHVCVAHDHGHHHDHADEETVSTQRERTSRRGRLAVAFGAVAASVAGIGVSVGLSAPAAHAPVIDKTSEMSPVVETDKPILESSPSPVPETYTVRPGDTLWQIAEQEYCDDSCNNQQLVEYVVRLSGRNQLANPDLIYPDQELVLPRA